MITRHFMHSLRHTSPSQRIFRRLILRPAASLPTGWILIAGLIIFFFTSALPNINLLRLALVFSVAAFVIALLNGFFQGALITLQISDMLARNRERGLYDLLCVLPGGGLFINWFISVAYLQRMDILRLLNAESVWITRVLFSVMIVFSLAQPNPGNWEGPLLAFTQFTALCAAFYFEDMQSITLCSIVGMLSPTYSRSPADARLHAIMTYIGLQSGFYLVILISVFSLMPLALSLAGSSTFVTGMIQAVAGLIWFYSLREGIIHRLWSLLLHRLDISHEDHRPTQRWPAPRHPSVGCIIG